LHSEMDAITRVLQRFFRSRLQHLTWLSSNLSTRTLESESRLTLLCTHTRWLVHVASIQDSRVHSEPGLDMQRLPSYLTSQSGCCVILAPPPSFSAVVVSRVRTLSLFVSSKTVHSFSLVIGSLLSSSLSSLPISNLTTHTKLGSGAHGSSQATVLYSSPSCPLLRLSVPTLHRSTRS